MTRLAFNSTLQKKNLEMWLALESYDDGIKKIFCRALKMSIPIEECVSKIRGKSSTEEKLIILKKMIDEKTGSCVK